ncbi:hypothetical protein KAU11_03250 [Candidatus Babeliales bacterium]|nr:hypothetical protein [Candidatus Babeliales bacterium]
MKFKKIIILLTLAIFSHLNNTNLEAMHNQSPEISALLIGGQDGYLSYPEEEDSLQEMQKAIVDFYRTKHHIHKNGVLVQKGNTTYYIESAKTEGKYPTCTVQSLIKKSDTEYLSRMTVDGKHSCTYLFQIIIERS